MIITVVPLINCPPGYFYARFKESTILRIPIILSHINIIIKLHARHAKEKKASDLFYCSEDRLDGCRNWVTLIGGRNGFACESRPRSDAFPYSRDRGVNSAYLSVRCAMVPFFTPGNDPFVRRVSATLSENVHSANDNDGLRPEYIAPIARGR